MIVSCSLPRKLLPYVHARVNATDIHVSHSAAGKSDDEVAAEIDALRAKLERSTRCHLNSKRPQNLSLLIRNYQLISRLLPSKINDLAARFLQVVAMIYDWLNYLKSLKT